MRNPVIEASEPAVGFRIRWRIHMRTHIVWYMLKPEDCSIWTCCRFENSLQLVNSWWVHARGAMPGLKYPYTLSSVVNFWKLEEVFWKRNRSPMGAVHICMPEGLMRNPVIEASLCKHIECDILHLKVAKLCYRTQWLPEVHLKDRSIQTHCLVWWTSEN
jgi:hypothetical protein